jgi:peptide/nickel transport system permease protein
MDHMNSKLNHSYWQIVMRQFKKNRMALWSLRLIFLVLFVGVFADFLANDKPIYCQYQGKHYVPILNSYGVSLGVTKWPKEFSHANWSEMSYEKVWRTPIPYAPQNLDLKNSDYVGPFDDQNVDRLYWRHLLGTDQLGRDVMSGMIHGTRTAMLVGVISMSIAVFIGIFFGALAGYFGDHRLEVTVVKIAMTVLTIIIGLFYGFGVRGYILSVALRNSLPHFFVQLMLSLGIVGCFWLIGYFIAQLLERINFFSKKVKIPLDLIISRLIEVKVAVPSMLLILSIVSLMKAPSILMTMVIIGLTSWTSIAKYTRAELLKVRNLEYVQAAQSLGYSDFRIIIRHALPNSMNPVLISIAFGIAGAILLESSLSFLGIGVRAEDVTWGSMLSSARGYFKAWWLAIFPGFAIFLTVTAFNLLGEGLNDAMNPKLR